MKAPKTILSHPAVMSVADGEEQGSDSKYWVFLKDGWGYYEGARESYNWVCGGFAVDSVAEFKSLNLEKKD
jgi:hypothetical protein